MPTLSYGRSAFHVPFNILQCKMPCVWQSTTHMQGLFGVLCSCNWACMLVAGMLLVAPIWCCKSPGQLGAALGAPLWLLIVVTFIIPTSWAPLQCVPLHPPHNHWLQTCRSLRSHSGRLGWCTRCSPWPPGPHWAWRQRCICPGSPHRGQSRVSPAMHVFVGGGHECWDA
jgi:hypothetical protein